MADSMVRKKELLLLSMMVPDEEMCNFVGQKRWTNEWLKIDRKKGAYYTTFKELAVEDTLGSADVFLNFVPRGRHLERLLLKAYGIANGGVFFFWCSQFCNGDSLQEQCTRRDIENWVILYPLHDAQIQTT